MTSDELDDLARILSYRDAVDERPGLREVGPDLLVVPFWTKSFCRAVVHAATLTFESAAQLVRVFDEGAAKVRRALEQVSDGAWSEPWKLSFQSKTIFEGSRFLAYRQMFLNHIIHHRAQLGVYLRLNSEPVPATYGPSADDRLGF